MLNEILILFLLILVNGLFSMSEIAVISSRKARLQQNAEDGISGAKTALALSEKPTHFLSTIQFGITLIGILSGAFGGATVANKLEVLLNQYAWLAPYSKPLAVGIVVVLVTFFSLILGELVPKRLALNDSEKIASAVAPLMLFISKLASPLVYLLSSTTDGVLRLLGVKPSDQPPVTEEEIRILVDLGRRSGVFEDLEHEMIERVLRLGDRTVNSLMTHRSEMIWLDIEDPFEENMRKIIASGRSNFVVCREDLDHFVGVISAKTLLAEYVHGKPGTITTSGENPPFVPEGMKALELVRRLREAKSSLALVTDEFGSISGMITLTDVLEAIVGDIPSSSDEIDEPEAVQRDDGSWLFDGVMAVEELQMILDIDELPYADSNYDTVGGLVMACLGHVPAAGDHFEWNDLRFEVMDMDGLRVDKVLVSQAPPPLPSEAHHP